MNLNGDEGHPREIALKIVQEFMTLVDDQCHFLEIAGSIRRNKPRVKDAELVGIPKVGLLARLDRLVIEGTISKALYGQYPKETQRWGDTYRGLLYKGLRIEIFLASHDNVGNTFWLRTGPGDANEWLVSRLKYHSPFLAREGFIWLEFGQELTADSKKIAVPSEEAFFKLLGIDFIPPQARSELRYMRAIMNAEHQWGVPERFVEDVKPVQKSLF